MLKYVLTMIGRIDKDIGYDCSLDIAIGNFKKIIDVDLVILREILAIYGCLVVHG